MALNLGPGERVVFEGHPSWRAILSFYVKGILIIVAAILLVVLFGNTFGDGVSGTAVAIVLFAGSILVALIGFIRRRSTDYTITNRRLYIKHGLISRDVQETRIERVQDISYSQSVLQRLLQIGDVDFDTAAQGSEGDFVFAGIAQPGKVTDRVHRATAASALGPRGRSAPDA